MIDIGLHIIYILIIIGASYLAFRLGQRSAKNAIKQLKKMKAELERKSKGFPLVKLVSVRAEVGRISMRLINVADETIMLKRIEAQTETFYNNPDDRKNPIVKVFKPFDFNNYQLKTEKTLSIEFSLDPIKHYDSVDFKVHFKYLKGRKHWVRYRLISLNHNFILIDAK